MNPAWRRFTRALLIAAGVAVAALGCLQFRASDWPIYVVYLSFSLVLGRLSVEVLPRLGMPIPELAATIGFLYIAGLPIVVFQLVVPFLAQGLFELLPQRWQERLARVGWEGTAVDPNSSWKVGQLFAEWRVGHRPLQDWAVEWAVFALGLGARWWVASAWSAPDAPFTDAGAIAVAEVVGHLLWGFLAVLPIFPDRALFQASGESGSRAALIDIGMIIALAQIPFVFLITYGYTTGGLAGAAGWALTAIGLHFMLKRLSERRIRVEEQNRRLEALNRELEHRERLSAIGKMSSVVSHQILQQLGVIGIYADLIRNADHTQDAAASLEQARSNAGAIENALGDVNRVLTDLLVFSRDLRLNLYEHELAKVIHESVDQCRAAAEEHGVTLQANCPSDLKASLDKLKITQAFVNLLRNAIEVSPRGGRVLIAVSGDAEHARVTVSDQGPGIAGNDREAIFAPFFTTKEHGTGLGLSIARVFIEAHGGRVFVEPSAPGSGARFVVELPRLFAERKLRTED
jgi:signal transduction histidine kinase